MPKKEKERAEKVVEKGEGLGKGLKKGHIIALEAGRGLKKGLHKQQKEE